MEFGSADMKDGFEDFFALATSDGRIGLFFTLCPYLPLLWSSPGRYDSRLTIK